MDGARGPIAEAAGAGGGGAAAAAGLLPAASRLAASAAGSEVGAASPLGFNLAAALGLCAVVALAAFRFARKRLRASGLSGAAAWNAARVLATIALFMMVGPALITLNKHIMQVLHFPYPLTLSGLGVLTSAVVSRMCVALGLASVRPESLAAVSGDKWLRTAMPVGASKACTLASGNAAYLYLGLGFIQMLKAFTPAVVLAVMWALGATRASRPAKWFVYIMVAGTMVEVKGELHATALGLFLMIVSEVAEAVSLVLTQNLLQNCKFTVIEGLYCLAPPSACFLFGVAACLEWPAMLRNNHQQVIGQHPMHFVAACLLGLSVNFVGMLLVQVTSSLFCKILNTVRCVGLVLLGVLFYGEECGRMEAFGYTVALLGFTGYNYVQMFPNRASALEQRVDACFCKQKGFIEVNEDTERTRDS